MHAGDYVRRPGGLRFGADGLHRRDQAVFDSGLSAPEGDTYREGHSLPSVRIVNDKLYVMKLEGAASHYFNASVLEFNDMVSSAIVTADPSK